MFFIRFWPFKAKKNHKSKIRSMATIDHKSGEKISIIIEGETPELVAYVSNKIKRTFDLRFTGLINDGKIWEHSDKIFNESNILFDEFDKIFRK